jgi:hypothetical protein
MALFGPKVQNDAAAGADEPADFLDRRGIDPVLGVAQPHVVSTNRVQHGGNVLPGPLQHLGPRHPVPDWFGIARFPEVAGQRLLDDHMLASLGSLDGEDVVQGRGDTQVHRVHILPVQQGGKIRGGERDLKPPGAGLGALAGPRADPDDLHPRAPKRGKVLQVDRRTEPRTHHCDPDLVHGFSSCEFRVSMHGVPSPGQA